LFFHTGKFFSTRNYAELAIMILRINLLLLFFSILSAQTDSLPTVGTKDTVRTNSLHSKTDNPSQEYHFLQSLGNNFYEQTRSPFTLDRKELVLLGAGVIITGTLILCDPAIDNFFSPLDNKNKFIRRTSPNLTEFGGRYGLMSVAGFGVYSIVWNNKKAQQTTLLMTEALITSGVWVRITKIVFSRERPSAASNYSHEKGGEWYWFTGFFSQSFQSVGEYDAFPSGHTSTAFAIAAVIDDCYGENFLVTPIVYSAASVVGITRMIEHAHWASDVFVGGVLGYLCGKQVVHHFRQLQEPNGTDMDISLGLLGRNPAVVFSVKF
jgi:membrane-associated phospholipid phosphatase